MLGTNETIPIPNAEPNAIRTSDRARATSAPAITALHCTKDVATSRVAVAMGSEASTRRAASFDASISGARRTTE